MLIITGCSRDQSESNTILGSWETETKMSFLGVSVPDSEGYQTLDVIYRIEFYEDGSGKSNIIFDEEHADRTPDTNLNFIYILDGDKLELTHESGNTQTFTVSFSDDKLVLDGRAKLELIRKK